jgi:hypothetical protein
LLLGFLPVQPAWYRKIIFIPAAAKGQRLWIEFDGVLATVATGSTGGKLAASIAGIRVRVSTLLSRQTVAGKIF